MSILKHLLGKSLSIDEPKVHVNFTDRELSGLKYLAGCIFHKIFVKMRKSKKFRTDRETKWCCELLRSCKLEEHSHRLIGIKDRGGLLSRSCFNFLNFRKNLSREYCNIYN